MHRSHLSNVTIVIYIHVPCKKFAQTFGVSGNLVLIRNGCIKCYLWLFKQIILKELNEFQTEIKGSLTKLPAFKVPKGYPVTNNGVLR